MANLSPYSEKRLIGATDPSSTGATFTDATDGNGSEFTGFGSYSQLTARLEVATVSGGADTFDAKIQYKIGEDWVDLITFTQLSGAGAGETIIVQRTESTSWTDRMRTVTTAGAGATATGVILTLAGAMGAGESTVTVDSITAVTAPAKAATATVTGVADTASSTTLLAANTSREGVQVHNESTSTLYVKYGGTASIASGGYTVKIAAGAYWEMPHTSTYTGVLHAIWSSDASGYANVTELTA